MDCGEMVVSAGLALVLLLRGLVGLFSCRSQRRSARSLARASARQGVGLVVLSVNCSGLVLSN